MLHRLLQRKTASATSDVLHQRGEGTETVGEHMSQELDRLRADLRASEERYSAFACLSSEGIWRLQMEHAIPVDLAEDEQIDAFFRLAVIAECNNTMAGMYGRTSQELIGAKFATLVQRDDPRVVDTLRAFIRAGYESSNGEMPETNAEGKEQWFALSLAGIVEQGRLTGAWGMRRDVTALKHAQQEISLLNAEFEHKVEERARALLAEGWTDEVASANTDSTA